MDASLHLEGPSQFLNVVALRLSSGCCTLSADDLPVCHYIRRVRGKQLPLKSDSTFLFAGSVLVLGREQLLL